MNHYPSNLSDNQWQVIEKFLDVQVRKRKYSLRSIVNAINYLLKTGCQWRMLPKDFPPYNLVYYYFSKWKNEGVFEELFFILHIWLHVMLGRAKCPSLGLIDSRSVKTGLPDRGRSYVVGQNGEPLLTFYRPNSGLFCNAPLSDDDTPYFLNIRRPVIIDVENIAPTVIPNDLPSECDRIIFLNYGAKKLTAFYVKDIESQSMRF